MRIARSLLRTLTLAAINSASIPDVIVQSPDDWPNTLTTPTIRVTSPSDTKTADEGNSGPAHFKTTVLVRVEGRLQTALDTDAQDQIEALAYLVENAIFTYKPLFDVIERVASVEGTQDFTADGEQHLGAFAMDIRFETYEADHAWDPPTPGVPIGEIIAAWSTNGTTPATPS